MSNSSHTPAFKLVADQQFEPLLLIMLSTVEWVEVNHHEQLPVAFAV